jgi:hypothetical protein
MDDDTVNSPVKKIPSQRVPPAPLGEPDELDDPDQSVLVKKSPPLPPRDLLGFAKLVIILYYCLFTAVSLIAIYVDAAQHLPTILHTVFSWVPAVIALVLGYYFGQNRQ